MTRLIVALSAALLLVTIAAIGLDVIRINELRADQPYKICTIGKFEAWNRLNKHQYRFLSCGFRVITVIK